MFLFRNYVKNKRFYISGRERSNKHKWRTASGDDVCMCSACQCNPVGSVDLQCDITTGQCRCRDNIDGQNCDKCEENKYNMEAGCLG